MPQKIAKLMSVPGLSALFAAALVTLLSSTGSFADIDQDLVLNGWQEFTFDGKRQNQFVALDDGGIDIVSQGSVSLLQRPVSIDMGTAPTLHWRWCVTEAAPVTDLSEKGADDRSLSVYVAFPFVEEEATAFEKIERKIVEATIGEEAPWRVLIYVWGGEKDRGTVLKSPHMGDSGVMEILRPGHTPSGQWFDEAVNVADDYRSAFGTEPPPPLYIAVGADTDDTESRSRGLITNLGFNEAERIF